MKARSVTWVRIYLREGKHILDKLVKSLHEEHRVAGLTVLRGVLGFGGDGHLHSASLLDLSLDLPLVVEFFEEPKRAERVVADLLERFPLTHILCIPSVSHEKDGP